MEPSQCGSLISFYPKAIVEHIANSILCIGITGFCDGVEVFKCQGVIFLLIKLLAVSVILAHLLGGDGAAAAAAAAGFDEGAAARCGLVPVRTGSGGGGSGRDCAWSGCNVTCSTK